VVWYLLELDEVVADLKLLRSLDSKWCPKVYWLILQNVQEHHFGWNYGGGTVADGKGGILRREKWIPIQITATGWWKGKFRGKAPAVKVLQIAQPLALSQVSILFWHVHHQKVDSTRVTEPQQPGQPWLPHFLGQCFSFQPAGN